MDMKTVLISYLITNAICMGVIGALYWQNRKQFNGLGFWLADYVMQFAALLLVAMRGIAPDFISMVVGNGFAVGGTILLYMGLEQFTGKRGTQWHNATLFVLFISVHSYFAVVSPNLTARNINLALALFVVCAQCAWLLLRRVDGKMRLITREAGLVFAVYCLVNAGRVLVDLAIPSGNSLFHSNLYDISAVMAYQMLFIVLTFSLFLMVNRSLLLELREDNLVRQQTEDALRFSEEKFLKAFHAGPDSIAITHMSNGRFVEVNEGFSSVTGYSRKEALNSTSIALRLWAKPQDRKSFVHTLQKEHVVRNAEYSFRAKSGTILNGLLSAEIIHLGNEPHIISIIHDITDRKRAEEALRESESLLNEAQRISHVGNWHIDIQKNKPGWSEEVFRIFEIDGKRSEATYDTFLAVVHPEDRRATQVAYSRSLETREPYETEYRLLMPDGRIKFVRERCETIFDSDGTPLRSVGTVQDITERKQAEEALRASEERLRLVLENSYDGFNLLDLRTGKYVLFNSAQVKMTGFEAQELEQMTDMEASDRIHPADREISIEQKRRLAAGEEAPFTTEYRWRVKSGEYRWFSDTRSIVRDAQGQPIALVGISRDITERKQVEEELRASEKHFKELFHSFPLASFIWKDNGAGLILMNVNHTANVITQNKAHMFIGHTADEIYPDRPDIVENLKKCLRERSVFNQETQYVARSTEILDHLIFTYVFVEPDLVMLHSENITGRKQAEEELHLSKERFVLAAHAANLGVWDWDIQKNVLTWDDRMYELYGVRREDFSGAYDAWLAGIHPDDREASDEISQQARQGEREYDTEFRIIWPNGNVRTIKAYGQVTWDSNGNPIRMTGINYDTTRQKQAEEALRESEARFSNAFEFAPIGMALVSPDGHWVKVNRSIREMLGYTKDELLATTFQALTHPDDLNVDLEYVQQILRGEVATYRMQKRYLHKSGKIVWALLSVSLIRDEGGTPQYFISQVVDITERKRAEESLERSRKLLDATLNILPVGVCLNDENGHYRMMNDAYCAVYEYDRNEMIGKHFSVIMPPDQVAVANAHYARLLTGDTGIPTERKRQRKDGSIVYIEAANALVEDVDGQKMVITTVRDVTERKRAEEEVRESRETLSLFIKHSPIYAYIKEVTPAQSRVIQVSENYVEMIGIPSSEMIGKTMEELFPVEFAEKVTVDDWAVASSNRVLNLEEELNGRRYTTIKFPLPRKDKPNLLAGYSIDITERKEAEDALRESEERYRSLYNNTPVMMHSIDSQGRLLSVSDYWLQSLGYTRDEVLGRSSTDFLTEDSRRYAREEALPQFLKDGQCNDVPYQFVKKNGEVIDVLLSAISEKDAERGIIRSLAVIIDITERKEAEMELRTVNEELVSLQETLREQAIRDPLTNLHNRRYLNETLRHEVARAKRENYPISIMMIDIDRFKDLNDTYGHSAGDEVLKSLSRLLVNSIRQGDIACRYGGEEFLVVMIGAHETDVERRAQGICRDFNRLRMRFDEQELSATVSIGVAFYPRHGVEIQQVIGASDTALYQAKQAGRNRVCVWKKN